MKHLHQTARALAGAFALLRLSAVVAAGDCVPSCNDARQAALSACAQLPAEEHAACIAAALDSYDACTRACAAALEPPFVRGDANRDGGLDLADAVFVLAELFAGGGPSSCPDASDANDDGRIDIADPIRVLEHLFRDTGPLPAPAGSPGPDPTAGDALRCYGGGGDVPSLDLLLPRDTRTATFSLG